VDQSRFFWVPLPMAEAASYLQAHPPAGTRDLGDGNQRDGHFFGQFVFYGLTTAPPGIDRVDSQLLVSLAAGPHRGTVLRADAEMVWYPPRSAAEYVPPAAYHRVAVRATFSWRRPSTVTRSFSSAAIVGKIARLFDDLHTVPPGTVFCPAVNASYTITFAAARSRPRLIVTADRCVGDLIIVAGKAQPGLADFESMRVLRVIAPLLGVHRKSW
jgi:hypothetical protein